MVCPQAVRRAVASDVAIHSNCFLSFSDCRKAPSIACKTRSPFTPWSPLAAPVLPPPAPSWTHVSTPHPPSLSPFLFFLLAIDASRAASSSRLRPDKRAGSEVLDQGVPRHAQHGGQGNEDHQRHAQAVGEPDPTVGRLGQDATRQVSPGCALRRAKGGEKEREAACTVDSLIVVEWTVSSGRISMPLEGKKHCFTRSAKHGLASTAYSSHRGSGLPACGNKKKCGPF